MGILGTGAFVPPRVVTNNQAGASAGIDDAWIFARTAIRTRRWADPEQATSDLAVQAAEQALANAAINAGQLGAVIVSTSTPDQLRGSRLVVQSLCGLWLVGRGPL
ncbi:hypothetical protein [Mycobacterium marinum]|uniref:hypothetical protein n=1 Tax=Mycobacterium marinum TaxID=1781 RepID=UPI001FB77497|nr:hypothetical protein [Mycobacterium marinum]